MTIGLLITQKIYTKTQANQNISTLIYIGPKTPSKAKPGSSSNWRRKEYRVVSSLHFFLPSWVQNIPIHLLIHPVITHQQSVSSSSCEQ